MTKVESNELTIGQLSTLRAAARNWEKWRRLCERKDPIIGELVALGFVCAGPKSYTLAGVDYLEITPRGLAALLSESRESEAKRGPYHLNTTRLIPGDAHYQRIIEHAVLAVSVWNRCQDAKLVRLTLLDGGDRLQIEIADADSTDLDGEFTLEEGEGGPT
jgi:hypothetical protein